MGLFFSEKPPPEIKNAQEDEVIKNLSDEEIRTYLIDNEEPQNKKAKDS